MKKYYVLVIAISIVGLLYSCSQIKQITQTLTNLEKLQFKLGSVQGFKLYNVSLSDKKNISDFSALDAANFLSQYNQKKMPAEFTLNLLVKNPNTGTQGTSKQLATISKLDWRLIIDDVSTINGTINQSISVPGNSQETAIPIGISLDLLKFFNNKSYDNLFNLALALGGVNGTSSKLKLDIQPTVSTPLGPITYPSRITVINTEFKN
ncbi:MAG TPA: hypothetical protein PK762_07785 [Candidatus Kapabacteria bacterium]|mgnify:FL=1|nr:hypothetical protein [Candidatus Kapabacteria bacterium]